MEIKYRWELIQYLIDSYHLKRYLEIGVQGLQTFKRIKCETKVGIDPTLIVQETGLYKTTSDKFFESIDEPFDIIFVDGLHLCEQAAKDIINSYNNLRPCGVIVVHDCLPLNEDMASRKRITLEWTGDVWRAMVWFRKTHPNIPSYVVNIDYGCGVIFKTPFVGLSAEFEPKLSVPTDLSEVMSLDYDWLMNNLEFLNVVPELK